MPYLIIIVVVLIASPFILRLAQSQDKKDKRNLKHIFLIILVIQICLGLLNWENFTVGRSGFGLSLAYPNSFLGFFFILSLIQIMILLLRPFDTLVVVLNFFNSVLIFIGMTRLSNILGFQAVSLASIGAVFLVLAGNVVSLSFINKDRNLLKKYLR